MEIAWLSGTSWFRIVLSVLFLCAISFGNCQTSPSQDVFAPFPTPRSAPGIAWPSETLKNLRTLESYLDRAAKSRNAQLYARVALNIGNLHLSVSDLSVAVEYYKRGLDAAVMAKDEDDEAAILGNMGTAYGQLGQVQEAADCLNKALDLQVELLSPQRPQRSPETAKQLQHNETSTLLALGKLYLGQQQYSKALDFLNRALTAVQGTGNLALQTRITMSLGLVYLDMGDVQKGSDLLKQAVTLFEQNNDKSGEASALINMGGAYETLGEYAKALEYWQRALPLKRELHDRLGEAGALNDIGYAYSRLGDKRKALPFLTQALAIYQEVGEKDHQAAALANIGYVTGMLGDREGALTYYAQALPLAREVNDRAEEAGILGFTGFTYAEMGNRQKALDYYNQALPIITSLGNPRYEADIFYAFLRIYKDDQPALAIFYGKQAVNHLQQVRENIKGMGEGVQSSFLASQGVGEHPITDYYHSLADLLIAQGRLPEAQQILDLLKDQEYADYARGGVVNASSAPAAQPAPSLTASERQGEQELQKATEPIVALGEQWEKLKKMASHTADEEKQFQELSKQLSQGSQQMNSYYARMYTLFGKGAGANKEVAEVKGNAALLKQQIAHMPRTVALYTTVTQDRYTVIVITGATMVAREFRVSERDLNGKLEAFARTLRTASQDPKPLAQELYKILVGPVAADLEQAHASTLLWVLDGELRYVPMSALHDGKQYLVQRYNSVSILPVSIPHLSDKPDMRRISVIGLGISKGYGGLEDLPSVETELEAIVRDPNLKNSKGVLPGVMLLNGDFTERAMEQQLSTTRSIVHIASHFIFSPGDDSRSYLLLAGKEQAGDGYRLTVADFRDNQKLALDDTLLLTLSACDTGVIGTASDGREIDGLATTAQLKGAESVIASLWVVNDQSTGDLMADFYRRWVAANGSVTKGEALRQAQIDLLTGKIRPKADLNAADSFAHPYYWAPFVLTGNWQ